MNYKSKLLSVFLSAGILLNSTSMAFAGQDSVNAKLGDQYGWLLMRGRELSAEQGNDEKEGNITWTFEEKNSRMLDIDGHGRAMKDADYPVLRDRWVNPHYDRLNLSPLGQFTYYKNSPYYEPYYENKKVDDIEYYVESLTIRNTPRIGNYNFSVPETIFCESYKMFRGTPFYPSLERVYMEKVEVIGRSAFAHNNALKIVIMSEDLKVIEDYAFLHTGIRTLELPSGIKAIGTRAFAWNGLLTTVNIPNSVETIREGAFDHCDCLTSITLPKRFKDQIDTILGDAKYNKGLKIEYTEQT